MNDDCICYGSSTPGKSTCGVPCPAHPGVITPTAKTLERRPWWPGWCKQFEGLPLTGKRKEIWEFIDEVYQESAERTREEQTMFHSCLCGKMPTPEEQAKALAELDSVKFLMQVEWNRGYHEGVKDSTDQLNIDPSKLFDNTKNHEKN